MPPDAQSIEVVFLLAVQPIPESLSGASGALSHVISIPAYHLQNWNASIQKVFNVNVSSETKRKQYCNLSTRWLHSTLTMQFS
jgi:hypothetical protein